jgi:uncharacterized protein (TIGR04255 family)
MPAYGTGTVIETLAHPPIREAIIDIKVVLPPEVGVEDLGALTKTIKSDYPQMKRRRTWSVELGEDSENPASKDMGVDGFLGTSGDGHQAVQFRLDGFTFSRLAPYQGWAPMLSEALRLWQLFVQMCKPQLLTRLGVRYINSISIPRVEIELDDYFTIAPRTPQGGTDFLEGFFSRVVVVYPAAEAKAIIVLASLPQATGESPFLLDIGAFSEKYPGGFDATRIEQRFDRLRGIKNEVFFSSITQKTKEMFQ